MDVTFPGKNPFGHGIAYICFLHITEFVCSFSIEDFCIYVPEGY